ncbi:MAG: dihydroorotate dehydrogenase-like protein [Bacteroidales bacterium]|nr:dihydroorotate dehydrogenase-like protein [Lentimicrobiaceae bacterium]MDD5695856.1 dihydroorotate dehydrogenase-like protein [Bacteroidales bacterium]
MSLSTSYLGLSLSSPIIVSSSRLTGSAENIKIYARKGAGAIVLKSIFEEQIMADITEKLDDHPMYYWYPRAAEHIMDISKEHGINEYIRLIKEVKDAVAIPVIASVNCISPTGWPRFAGKLQEAGADALELNIAVFPFDETITGNEVEEIYFSILKAVKSQVTIPVSVKIGSYFSNLPRMIKRLDEEGVDGVVMFNRFFRPDIDIDSISIVFDNYLSSPVEITEPLRWIGSLSNKVRCDISASTGIHDYAGVIKVLLAGARAAQICTTLYRNGPDVITQINEDLAAWMQAHRYPTIEHFRGKILQGKEKTGSFERIQFMRKNTGMNV